MKEEQQRKGHRPEKQGDDNAADTLAVKVSHPAGRTGKRSTPVIMTNNGTQQRTALPSAHPCRKAERSESKRATKGSQQWANTTRKQAMMRNTSTHPTVCLDSIPMTANV